MVQKRPFYDEELYSISSKQPKQVEHGDQLVSFSEFVPPQVASPYVPGEDGYVVYENTEEGDKKHASDVIATLPLTVQQDIETAVPRSDFVSSWFDSCTGEEASRPAGHVHVSLALEYVNAERPTRTVAHYKDMYSLLLHYPPRKVVTIGSNYQADIPEWGMQSKNPDSSESILDTNLLAKDKDDKGLMGTCVIPMPALEHADEVGNIVTDCSCLDKGSIGCVRQHVTEARKKLKRALGQERFVELGFCDMGEQVAGKWSEKEEQLFHEIVFFNPVSLGKNFWYHLSAAFPYRTTKDIVCYYFNVFMLRRRAEQNRCDQMNIDSDSDEWQGSDVYDDDDDDDDELGMTEEDKDSIVESPMHQDDCAHNLNEEDDVHVHDEGAVDDVVDNEDFDFSYGRNLTNFSDTCPGKTLDNYNFNARSQLLDKISWDERADQEVQDDSCTSTDTGVSSQGNQVRVTNDGHYSSCNGLSGGSGRDVLEPCDAKDWDIDYTMCPKNKVDFLPTCSMIEEIFGDENM